MTKEKQALEAIRAETETLSGHLGFYYKNLVTGEEYGIRADEAYLAASVIKLPLFLHVLGEINAGRMAKDEKLTVEEWEKMPSCGALTLFTGDITVDIMTLCRLMIDLSDNTATNKLIRRCTIEGAQQGFARLGLEKTVLRRLLFDSEASARGIENTICPKEIGMLLEQLYAGAYISNKVSEEALGVLKKQQIRHKTNGKLSGCVAIANKTGEDSGLSNDVAIVFAKEPFIVCWAGHDTDVYRWEDLIRRGTYELVQAQN